MQGVRCCAASELCTLLLEDQSMEPESSASLLKGRFDFRQVSRLLVVKRVVKATVGDVLEL